MKLSPVKGTNKEVFLRVLQAIVSPEAANGPADADSTNGGAYRPKVVFQSSYFGVYAESGNTVDPSTTIED
jgi:hypothetical protein